MGAAAGPYGQEGEEAAPGYGDIHSALQVSSFNCIARLRNCSSCMLLLLLLFVFHFFFFLRIFERERNSKFAKINLPPPHTPEVGSGGVKNLHGRRDMLKLIHPTHPKLPHHCTQLTPDPTWGATSVEKMLVQ